MMSLLQDADENSHSREFFLLLCRNQNKLNKIGRTYRKRNVCQEMSSQLFSWLELANLAPPPSPYTLGPQNYQ